MNSQMLKVLRRGINGTSQPSQMWIMLFTGSLIIYYCYIREVISN